MVVMSQTESMTWKKKMVFEIIAGNLFSSYGVGPLFRERRKILDTLEVLFLDLSGNRVEENDVST